MGPPKQFVGLAKRHMSNSPSKGTTLVTGASRGIGAVYADRLAKRGYDLILVARSEPPLKALTASLASASGRHITPIVADLNNKIDLAKVETKLSEDLSITMLVNNAGAASVAPLLNADIEKMEEMIALNSIARTPLAYAAAPAFVKRGTGTIINIGSVVGISPETLNGVYGATQAYVLAFSHSLQHELADKGIRVQAVLPGATTTETRVPQMRSECGGCARNESWLQSLPSGGGNSHDVSLFPGKKS
jgi:short-subunit dehydrogenase